MWMSSGTGRTPARRRMEKDHDDCCQDGKEMQGQPLWKAAAEMQVRNRRAIHAGKHCRICSVLGSDAAANTATPAIMVLHHPFRQRGETRRTRREVEQGMGGGADPLPQVLGIGQAGAQAHDADGRLHLAGDQPHARGDHLQRRAVPLRQNTDFGLRRWHVGGAMRYTQSLRIVILKGPNVQQQVPSEWKQIHRLDTQWQGDTSGSQNLIRTWPMRCSSSTMNSAVSLTKRRCRHRRDSMSHFSGVEITMLPCTSPIKRSDSQKQPDCSWSGAAVSGRNG